MRVLAAVLLGYVALLALIGAGCGNAPNQGAGPPQRVSPDRWTRLWGVSAVATPSQGIDGAVFANPGGWMLISVKDKAPRHDWSFSGDLRPAAWPRKALPPDVRSKTVSYNLSDGSSGQDYILTRVPKGRYYVNYSSDRPRTITVYVEK